MLGVTNNLKEEKPGQLAPADSPFSFFRRLVQKLVFFLQPLWVWGLITLFLLVGKNFTPVTGENYEWFQYIILGTIFPAVLLIFTLLPLYRPIFKNFFKWLQLAIIIASIPVLVAFLFTRNNFIFLLMLAAFQLAITLSPTGAAWRKAGLADRISWNIVRFFITTLAWVASVSILVWLPFEKWLFGSFYQIIISVGVVALALFGFYFPSKSKTISPANILGMFYRQPGAIGNTLVIFFFIFASLRSNQLFDQNALHHWGVFVGPAELVRQGGWLLWDVPSQYGFLNELLVAWVGLGSSWESFYLLNALTLLLSALFLFFLLRRGRSDTPNFLFAATVTYASVYLIPGWIPNLLGPQITPSEGAFRFIWCYPLIGVLLREYRQPDDTRNYRAIYLIGSVAWLLGCMWSMESLIYCTAIWIPAYTWMILRRAYFQYWHNRKKNLAGFLRFSISWLLLPAGLMLVTVTGISGFYKIRLGHFPDWSGYIEYALSFSNGDVGPSPISPDGPVWVMVLGFGIISSGLVFFLRQGFTQKAVGLMLGLFGALWATSSYFIPRSNINFILTITPILSVTVAITLYVISRHFKNNLWHIVLRLMCIPLFSMLLISTFGNQPGIISVLDSKQGEYTQIDDRIPPVDKDLQALFLQANIKSTDPVVYWDFATGMMLPRWQPADKTGSDSLSTSRLWLPLSSFALYIPLKKGRIEEYITRFTERAHLSGWLVQRSNELPRSSWLTDYLAADYTSTKTFSRGNWTITWFQYKSK